MSRRIVITGLGLISPLGLTLEDNWNSLINGISGIDLISSFECSSWRVKIAGEVKHFDPSCLPGSKKSVKLMNRDSQLAVAATHMALNNSKLNRDVVDPCAIGIAFGSFGIQYTLEDAYIVTFNASGKKPTWLDGSTETKCLNPIWPLTILPNMSLCHIAITHNIKGPNIAFCSLATSGAQAIGEAFKSIQCGASDIFVAGGCSTINPSYLFSLDASGLLADDMSHPSAACRPFDKERKGFVVGEGAAVVVLEELSHAQRRHAPIHAEVIGYHSNMQRGGILLEKESFEENVEGVAACLKEVIDQAGIDSQDVDYLNADGKATLISDRVETEAIKNVFGDYAYRMSISSTKSMMGHLLCASGPAEIIIGSLAIRDGIVPPTINYEHPDPHCDLEYTPNHFKRRDVHTVLSNTMGLSGENAAILLKKFC